MHNYIKGLTKWSERKYAIYYLCSSCFICYLLQFLCFRQLSVASQMSESIIIKNLKRLNGKRLFFANMIFGTVLSDLINVVLSCECENLSKEFNFLRKKKENRKRGLIFRIVKNFYKLLEKVIIYFCRNGYRPSSSFSLNLFS